MSELPPKPADIDPSRIVFLKEQTGAPEDELKAALTDIFTQHAGILAAYLVRVQYGTTEFNMALGLWVAPGTDPEPAVAAAGACFWRMFHAGEHLDIILLTPEELQAIRKVCKPFFRRQ